MSIDTDILQFARQHRDEDPLKLLLQQSKYPQVDMRQVVQQIEGQRQASAKWPTLAHCDEVLYPPKLNREQSSSEATAQYKAQLMSDWGGGTVADLTGGMGIDSLFMARVAETVDYCEQNQELCQLAAHNFAALGQHNIRCHSGDSLEWLKSQTNTIYNTIYIDPARRDPKGRKVSAFEECTPNLLDNLALLLSRCSHLLIKASPMIDLYSALHQLGNVADVHIVALNGECKEVLFALNKAAERETQIHCVELRGDFAPIVFLPSEEEKAQTTYASQMGQYLYEPHATLMKGGCFGYISQKYKLQQLARNTHLYTSDILNKTFPGRRFQVLQELKPKEASRIIPERKAHVVTRNYPMEAALLQKKLGLKEGGDLFVIGATLATKPTLWLCKLCSQK